MNISIVSIETFQSEYITTILNNNNLHRDSESEYAQYSTKNYLFVNSSCLNINKEITFFNIMYTFKFSKIQGNMLNNIIFNILNNK